MSYPNTCKLARPDHNRPSHADLLKHALDYFAIGWAPIPTIGKKPGCRWKQFQKQRPDPETLQKLFTRSGITGLAVILGPSSGGLACRDFDIQESYDRWARSRADLAHSLPTVATARGRHVYFRTSSATGIRMLPDGELRCSGGYCLVPPSLHPDGPVYRWLIPLPDGALPLLDPFQSGLSSKSESEDPTQLTPHPTHTQCASDVSVTELVDRNLPTGPGRRHFALLELVRGLKTLMPTAPPRELLPILQDWHARALAVIRTKDFAQTWQEFLTAWKGWSPHEAELQQAIVQAQTICVPDQPHHSEPARRLLRLCAALQEQYGAQPFFLGCRGAGEFLGIDKDAANRLLRQLKDEGFLVMVRKGRQQRVNGVLEYIATEWKCNPFAWGDANA